MTYILLMLNNYLKKKVKSYNNIGIYFQPWDFLILILIVFSKQGGEVY